MCKFGSFNLVSFTKATIFSIHKYWSFLMRVKDVESEIEQEKSAEMEKIIDCPLCLEPLEFDDKNFYPCTCGYQVCRFCWHRIRTNENGLCPACRRPYPEDPANFQPLTPEELQRVKLQKKLKDIQKKQKIAENRKQLANIRVIQKNLVFGVGLPLELSQDNQKKEKVLQMFRQFGPTQKEAITDRTSYAGSQGPSACVYITYQKPEDAIRACKFLTNTKMEGRTLKVSLGTTKYCSNFLKSIHCPKVECLYLHELADEEASFTKEDIHLGKHLEYEQKVIEQTLQSLSQNKINLPNGEANRINQNIDNCSESSDDVQNSGSFYDSSEASELSPSSNSQNLENNRSIESDLNVESEQNYQNVHSTNLESKILPETSSNHVFRSEENFIVNNHISNSSPQNISPNNVNMSHSNQMQLEEIESVPQSNFLHKQIYESVLNRESANPNESSFFRYISNGVACENGPKNSIPNILNIKQEHAEPSSRKRDDDPDLGFDPCQESLNGLDDLIKSEARERARIVSNYINRTSLSSKPVTIQHHPSENIGCRSIYSQQPQKFSDPPPGFTNKYPQNLVLRSTFDSGNSFLNRAPSIALHNQWGVRANTPVQRFQQPVTMNNSTYVTDYSQQLPRDVPDIIPSPYHQHNRFVNVPLQQFPQLEQRSTPLWNNATQSQWRPTENQYFNPNLSENRAANDYNLRMQQIRSNETTARQWQQHNGNMNTISQFPEAPQPMTSEQVAKMQAFEVLFKAFEAAQKNSGLGHRLQYTKKL